MPDPAVTARIIARSPVGPGDVLAGRYRLERALGSGGQAVVFEAANLRPGSGKYAEPERLAIKVARADLAPPARQEAAAVLLWEATLLRRAAHPALPRLWRSAGDATAAGPVWLARDLVPGQPLTASGPHDPRRVHAWAIELCDLLRYLHALSPPLICGDLKPSNLVLRPDGTLALIDLGAAHTRTRRPPRRPRPRHGTPGYAPPEQLGAWGLDERADIFSLGVTCYELLTGADPTAAPLQFDLARLDRLAPELASALRWALALEPAKRAPTAAALRAALGPQPPPAPLRLRTGAQVTGTNDLLTVTMHHPQAMEAALASGALERWLAEHSDARLGALLHRLRRAQEAPAQAKRGARRLDALLTAMAPDDGSPLLRATPARIAFGPIPLHRWRVWSPPQRLTLQNGAAQPLRWELICPRQLDADVRVLVQGKPARHWAGVIPPGGRAELDLVAVGRAGRRRGDLTLRCGNYTTGIPWEAEALPGLPVGGRIVARLADLDLDHPDLVAQLEGLARIGALQRWLGAQDQRASAADLAHAAQLDSLALRLLIARVLHPLSPVRFPLVKLGFAVPAGERAQREREGGRPDGASSEPHVVAGAEARHILEVANSGSHPCVAAWRSDCAWARVAGQGVLIPPGERRTWSLALAPPPRLPAGAHPVALTLTAGALTLPVTLTAHVTAPGLWQRVKSWLGGT